MGPTPAGRVTPGLQSGKGRLCMHPRLCTRKRRCSSGVFVRYDRIAAITVGPAHWAEVEAPGSTSQGVCFAGWWGARVKPPLSRGGAPDANRGELARSSSPVPLS